MDDQGNSDGFSYSDLDTDPVLNSEPQLSSVSSGVVHSGPEGSRAVQPHEEGLPIEEFQNAIGKYLENEDELLTKLSLILGYDIYSLKDANGFVNNIDKNLVLTLLKEFMERQKNQKKNMQLIGKIIDPKTRDQLMIDTKRIFYDEHSDRYFSVGLKAIIKFYKLFKIYVANKLPEKRKQVDELNSIIQASRASTESGLGSIA